MFRGGFATLLRESIGTATFFSTYELSRHYITLQLNSMASVPSHLPKSLSDVGVGIVCGGVAGMAVSSTTIIFLSVKPITNGIHSQIYPCSSGQLYCHLMLQKP